MRWTCVRISAESTIGGDCQGPAAGGGGMGMTTDSSGGLWSVGKLRQIKMITLTAVFALTMVGTVLAASLAESPAGVAAPGLQISTSSPAVQGTSAAACLCNHSRA